MKVVTIHATAIMVHVTISMVDALHKVVNWDGKAVAVTHVRYLQTNQTKPYQSIAK